MKLFSVPPHYGLSQFCAFCRLDSPWKGLAGNLSQTVRQLCKALCLVCLLSPGLTAAAAAAANAAIAEAMKVKKIKLEAMSGYHGNANHHGADGENGDLSSGVGEDAL